MSFMDVLLGFIGGGVIGGGGLYALNQGKLNEASQKYVQMREALDTAENELKDTKEQLLGVSEVRNHELENNYQRQIKQLEQSYQNRIAELEMGQGEAQQLQDELTAAQSRIAELQSLTPPSEDFTASYESQIQQLERDYQSQIDDLRFQIDDLRRSHGSEIQDLQQAHQSQIEELETSYQNRIRELEQTYQSQMLELQQAEADTNQWAITEEIASRPVEQPQGLMQDIPVDTVIQPWGAFTSETASAPVTEEELGIPLPETASAPVTEEEFPTFSPETSFKEETAFFDDSEFLAEDTSIIENSGFFSPEITEIQNPTYVEPWEELHPSPSGLEIGETVSEFTEETSPLAPPETTEEEVIDTALFTSPETTEEEVIDTALFTSPETTEEEVIDTALFTSPETTEEFSEASFFAPTQDQQTEELDDSFFASLETSATVDEFTGIEEIDNSLFESPQNGETIAEISSLEELDTSLFNPLPDSAELDFLESLTTETSDDNFGLFDEITSSNEEILNQIANQESEELLIVEENFSFETSGGDLDFFNSLQTEENTSITGFNDLFSGQTQEAESLFSELLPTESENLEELLLNNDFSTGDDNSWLTDSSNRTLENLDPFADIENANSAENNGYHVEEGDLEFLNMLDDVNHSGLESLPSDQDLDLPFDDLFGEDLLAEWDKDQSKSSAPDKIERHQ